MNSISISGNVGRDDPDAPVFSFTSVSIRPCADWSEMLSYT